jgi:hypothetical protein
MPAVGYTPLDVLRELQHRFEKFEPVVGAYMRHESRGNRITVTSLLQDFHPPIEAEIAKVEVFINQMFEDYAFDFVTVHLKGRDPSTFIRPSDTALLGGRAPRARQAVG